jgi:hypothetical protein
MPFAPFLYSQNRKEPSRIPHFSKSSFHSLGDYISVLFIAINTKLILKCNVGSIVLVISLNTVIVFKAVLI